MFGTEDKKGIKVRCKWCGAETRKHVDHHAARCRKCSKVTAYIVGPARRREA